MEACNNSMIIWNLSNLPFRVIPLGLALYFSHHWGLLFRAPSNQAGCSDLHRDRNAFRSKLLKEVTSLPLPKCVQWILLLLKQGTSACNKQFAQIEVGNHTDTVLMLPPIVSKIMCRLCLLGAYSLLLFLRSFPLLCSLIPLSTIEHHIWERQSQLWELL